ncbi:retrovirus-related pol polyprotein from transposon TNT 1-94 [Tanacetum coccineum]
MDLENYKKGQSMQRSPLFEANCFIYWKNRFETYVKSKDIDLWHIIVYGDYKPIIKNKDTGKEEVIPYEKFEEIHNKMISKNDEAKMVLYNVLPKKKYERIFMCKTAKDVWNSLIITHQGNKQVKDNKIDLFVQKYEEFVISDDETIDCAFARFNTIITSLKALDESFSSRNHVRKFLRALPTKWCPKVTAIEESKDLSTLPLDELIGNLKVYEAVLEKDLEASKNKKEKYKSLALKSKKVSSDEEVSCSGSDEEYAMAVRDFKKILEEEESLSDNPMMTRKTFGEQKKRRREMRIKDASRGCWSDSEEEDDSMKDEICLMALDNNEKKLERLEKSKEISVECESCVELHSKIESLSLKLAKLENSSYFLQEMIENQRTQKDKKGIGFTEDRASTSEAKIEKLGQESGKVSTIEPAKPVPSAREPAGSNVGNRPSAEVRLKVKLEPDEWIKDSGCSRHMTGNKDLFSTYEAINGGNVVFGSNTKSKIIGKGTITHNSLTIHDVSHVENLSFNLLSIGQVCDKKCKVLFSETGSEILKYGITIGRGIRKNVIYVMKIGNSPKDSLCLASMDDTSTLWHRRLGHANMRLIQSLSSKELVRNLPKLKFKSYFCDACNIGKQVHTSHKAKNMVSTTKCLELLHMDLFGPLVVQSYGGNFYTLVIVNDYLRYTWTGFLKYKNEAFDHFEILRKKIQVQKGCPIISVRMDHGREFDNEVQFGAFCDANDITHNFSAPRTHNQIG